MLILCIRSWFSNNCNLKLLQDLPGFVPGENDCVISGVSLVLFWLVIKADFHRNHYLGNSQIQHFISCFLCCCSFFHIFFSPCKDSVRKGLHELQSNCSLGAFCCVKTFLINMLLHFHLKISWWETHFKLFYQAKLDWKPSLLWKQLSDFPELVLDTQKLKKCFSSAPKCIQGN